MSTEQETLVEECCHLCDKLLAIAGFKGEERRRKDVLYLCDFCAQGDGAQFKRPSDDDLIIASISAREGNATKLQTKMIEKYGMQDERGPRYRVLMACHEARKKAESGDYKGSTMELLSILKTVVGGR